MKTTIFLGAGASASEGAPVQSKLFHNYFKIVNKKESAYESKMEEELANFFKLMFDLEVKVNEKTLKQLYFPTFEEALGILDLAEMRNESFKYIPNLNVLANSGQVKRLRLYLTLLMAEAINENLFTSKNVHLKLIKNLNKIQCLKNTVFISTNYDILIDNALTGLYPEISLDYGVEFVNFELNDDWTKPEEGSVKLFKIHGSLNWLYCSSCNSIKLTPKKEGVMKLIEYDHFANEENWCHKCETVYSPVIIPPSYYKDFANIFLNIVWSKAEKELLNSDHIIFCGYSFPDADIHIKYLIKRAQKNGIHRNFKISIVNNHPGKNINNITSEKHRFKRFLGHDVNYTKYSFEDFAKKPRILIK